MQYLVIIALSFYGQFGLTQSTNPFEIQSNTNIQTDTQAQIRNNGIDIATTNPFELISPSEGSIVEAEDLPRHNAGQLSAGIVYSALGSLIALIFLAISINLNRKRFFQLLNAFINPTTVKTLFRTQRGHFLNTQFILLYIVFWLAVSIFLLLILPRLVGFSLPWWSIFLLLIVVYGVRHIVMLTLQNVYSWSSVFELQNFNIALHNMLLPVIIIPVSFALLFSPASIQEIVLYIGLILIGISYLLRQLKGFMFSQSTKGFNTIYFFIYLCGVEIAPLLLLLKIIK